MVDEADDIELPHDVQGSSEGSGPISRSSVTHVAYIVSKFDDMKKNLVREIGFGGIIELPHITKVDRKFTLWLLSNLEPEKRCIVVNGKCITDLVDFEVARIMGIPCGRREVSSLDYCDKELKQKFISNYMASSESDINWLIAAENNVVAQYDQSSVKDIDKFKVSFVIWVMGHLLAPTKKHNTVSDRFWGALLVPGEIRQFNWSLYVLDELINAARDVQNVLKQNKPVHSICGCSILLQIMYFESIKMGSLSRPTGISPRVKVYDAKSLSLMIAADKASSASGSGTATWGSTVRNMAEAPNVSLPLSTQKCTDIVTDDSNLQHDIINDFGKYVRARFGDKVSTSQSASLNWFNARCIQHYKKLRLSIQNDMIDLVAKLFGTPNTPMPLIASEPSHINLKAGTQARSEPCKPPLYRRNSEKKKRPCQSYGSWCNGRGTKKHHGRYQKYEFPDTLLSGVSVRHEDEVGDQLSDCGKQSVGPIHNSGCNIEVPSFDLGIELNTDGNENHIVQSSQNVSIPVLQKITDAGPSHTLSMGVPDALQNPEKSLSTIGSITESSGDDNCVDSSLPSWYISLTDTPPSAYSTQSSQIKTAGEIMKLSLTPLDNTPISKSQEPAAFGTPEYVIERSSKAPGTSIAKSIDVSGFSAMDHMIKTSLKSPGTPPSEKTIVPATFYTPEQLIKGSSKSPASLSKILAEGDLVDRITHYEDSTDPNKKHWHGGYMESPIQKRLFATTELAQSPWTLNLCHRSPPRDIVEKLFNDVSASSYSILNRPWVAHNSPRHIELVGTWMHESFISGKQLSYDVFDLAIRRFNQLDNMMYSDSCNPHWRHILESDLAMYSLAGEQPYYWNSTCEQFIGSYLRYKIEDCRMIVAPAFILLNWCCYIFDLKEECVHVIDPLYNKDKLETLRTIHLPNVAKVADGVATSFEMFFNNWNYKLRQWDINFVEPCIDDATPSETGLLTLMYIREFDGSKIQFVNRDSFNYFKKLMLYELMSLSDNPIKAPVSLTITIDD